MAISRFQRWVAATREQWAAKTGSKRPDSRGWFERLEARTVLSASFGQAPAAAGGVVAFSSLDTESQIVQAGVYDIERPRAGASLMAVDWEDNPAYTGQGAIYEPERSFASARDVRPSYAETSRSAFVTPQTATIIVGFPEDRLHGSSPSKNYQPQLLQLSGDPPATGVTIGISTVAPRPSVTVDATTRNAYSPWSLPVDTSASIERAPTPSRTLKYDTSVSEMSSARDAVLDDLLRRAPRGTTISASDEQFPRLAGEESAAASDEAIEDFLGIGGFDMAEMRRASEGRATTERAAIDQVMDELHDVKALASEHAATILQRTMGESLAATAIADTLAQAARESGDSAVGGADGMVLLQAIGDPNECEFDLIAALDDKAELPAARLGMEASLGWHQAFDTDADEVPVGFAVRPENTDRLLRTKASADSLPEEGGKFSDQRAAAALGVTTLVGGILWREHKNRRKSTGREMTNDQ